MNEFKAEDIVLYKKPNNYSLGFWKVKDLYVKNKYELYQYPPGSVWIQKGNFTFIATPEEIRHPTKQEMEVYNSPLYQAMKEI